MFSKKTIFPPLASLLLLNAYLLAEETITENQDGLTEEHVSVGSREIDPARRERMQGLRAKEREEEEEESGNSAETMQTLHRVRNKLPEGSSQFTLAPREAAAPLQFSSVSAAFPLIPYDLPVDRHCLVSVANMGRLLEIEDGSQWAVSASDAYVLRNWYRGDTLSITPDDSWIVFYDYYIKNETNGTVIKANLHNGPLAFGPYSHWIIGIDHFNGHVHLERMVYCVNPKDRYILKDWALDDHIIFGLYNTWFSDFDHILINVNVNNYVRVQQY